MEVKINEGWKKVLNGEFEKDYFKRIVELLYHEKQSKRVIYPPGSLIFNAFNLTDFDKVKVVILGQDPYHGAGQAHGLSFSVQKGTKPPPSLVNIYKEIESDLGVKMPKNNGCLEPWANQGVLLLNASLTVRANDPNSHSGLGWNEFTDAVIKELSSKKEHLVFLLWGNFAKQKMNLIDATKHLILTAQHPSPFSVHKGFFGSKHFSKANEYLSKHGLKPINWLINEIE
jgi:uracil-DNA glycosylase